VTAAEGARVRVLAGHRPALAVVAGRPSAGSGQRGPAPDPASAGARRFAAAYVAECRLWGLPVTRAERKRAFALLQGGARP
jgi:hypothetical protein